MDKDLDYATIEDLFIFIQSFIESSNIHTDFGIFFTKGIWKTNLYGFPSVIGTDLRSALYLLALHLKMYSKDDSTYIKTD